MYIHYTHDIHGLHECIYYIQTSVTLHTYTFYKENKTDFVYLFHCYVLYLYTKDKVFKSKQCRYKLFELDRHTARDRKIAFVWNKSFFMPFRIPFVLITEPKHYCKSFQTKTIYDGNN